MERQNHARHEFIAVQNPESAAENDPIAAFCT